MKKSQTIQNEQQDLLRIAVFENPEIMGIAAAEFVSGNLLTAIAGKGMANMILATGASQFSFLDILKTNTSIDWSKVTVFHLDEYVGLPDTHPASFRKYLHDRILKEVKPKEVHYIKGDAPDISKEIDRYTALLNHTTIDIACIGIGENGHIAFNDPPVADFNDQYLIKKVRLDKACRMQQVGEGWFSSLPDVPTHALTLTIPAIMHSKTISCVVPDVRKAEAVKNTIKGPVSTDCPASILRTHEDCTLFLDTSSAHKISI